VDAVAFGEVTKEEGRERFDAVHEGRARIRLELNEAHLEELDVEAMLKFAERLVTNAARLWVEAKPEEQDRLQHALLPEGVTFGASGI
jgi:DNA-binding PucR family transcriptional regulator